MSDSSETNSQAEKPQQADRIRRLFFLVWAVIGVILLVIGAIYALGTVSTALAIIAVSAFIVFVLRVPVAWLETLGVPRALGALISYLVSLLIIALTLLLFIPIIWEQALGLIKMIPDYMAAVTTSFNELYLQYEYLLENSSIQQIVGSAASNLSTWAGSLVAGAGKGAIDLGTGVATSLVVFFLSLIVGFWVLKDLPKIGRELRVIIGPKHEGSASFISAALSNSFGGYLRGITICAFCTGTISGIGFWILGLPYPAVLGLLAGLLNFIPYVGPWATGLIAAIIGLFISPITALISVGIVILAQQTVDNLIYPRVMLAAVNLHPAIVLIGVFTGGAVGGFIGLIAAVPLLASAKLIFTHFFEMRTKRTLASEDGAFFKASAELDSKMKIKDTRPPKTSKTLQAAKTLKEVATAKADKVTKNNKKTGGGEATGDGALKGENLILGHTQATAPPPQIIKGTKAGQAPGERGGTDADKEQSEE